MNRIDFRGGIVVIALAVTVLALVLVSCGPREEAVQRSYNTACYREQGGDKWVCGSGGEMEVQSGATLDIQSGATFNPQMTGATITGNLIVSGTSDLVGGVSSSTGALTITDRLLIDGAADATQLQVQGHTTQTADYLSIEQYDGTDVFDVDQNGYVGVTGYIYDSSGTLLLYDETRATAASDAAALTARAYTTPTTDVFVVEQSDGTDLFAVGNDGAVDAEGTLSVADDVTLESGATIYGSDHTTGTHGVQMVALGSFTQAISETETSILSIPANANIVDVMLMVVTSWDDGASATLDCGPAGSTAAWIDDYDLNGASNGAVARVDETNIDSDALGDVGASVLDVRCVVSLGNGDQAAGEANLYVWYQVD